MQDLNIRIDKWLWMVRLFKTRSMATDACNAGKVKLNGTNVKPSKSVKSEECYHVRIGQLEKVVQVIDTPKSRVGAPLVSQYYTTSPLRKNTIASNSCMPNSSIETMALADPPSATADRLII